MFDDAARYVGSWEPGSPDWHEARRFGLGGSEVAVILGLSPFDSRFALWHRKTGGIGQVPENDEMEWGKRLEPVVLGKFADMHAGGDSTPMSGLRTAAGIKGPTDHAAGWSPTLVTHCGTWRSTFLPFAVANPDALLWTGDAWEVVEAKAAMWPYGWGPDGSTDDDAVPLHYRIQAMWYMGVLGLKAAHICVLIGGFDWRQYRIEFDTSEFALLAEQGRRFVDSLEAGDPPDIDEHVATYAAVREMHPDIDGTDHEVSDEVARLFVTAVHTLDAVEAQVQYARNLLADEMGNAKRARWCGVSLATRQAKGGGVPYIVKGRKLPTVADVTPADALDSTPPDGDPFAVTDEQLQEMNS